MAEEPHTGKCTAASSVSPIDLAQHLHPAHTSISGWQDTAQALPAEDLHKGIPQGHPHKLTQLRKVRQMLSSAILPFGSQDNMEQTSAIGSPGFKCLSSHKGQC